MLDCLLHAGSQNVATFALDRLFVVTALRDFRFVDELGKDHGAEVRSKAEDVISLLVDDCRLLQQRRSKRSPALVDASSKQRRNGEERLLYRPPRGRPLESEDEELRDLLLAIELDTKNQVGEQAKVGDSTSESTSPAYDPELTVRR